MELDPAIAGAAERHLAAAGATNVVVMAGDGWAPPPSGETFDRIEATVGVWDISPAWVEQLNPGGVLVIPLWLRAGQQGSIAFRNDDILASVTVEPCGFMRMQGPGAGEATYEQLGAWTVSLDRASPGKTRVLAALLDSESSLRPAPRLDHGWFTPIALGEPDAVRPHHPWGRRRPPALATLVRRHFTFVVRRRPA